MENEINDPEPLILNTLEAENTSTDNLLLASTPENSKGNFAFHVTPDEFHAFLAILLISG